METLADLPILRFERADAWEAWLNVHHAQSRGVWLQIAKKGSGVASVTYADALDVALCYGWIDAQKKSFDEASWLQKFSPRRPKSGWSRINTAKAEALIAAGRMMPSGQREVDAARQDGRWEAAYQSQAALTIPDDLRDALSRNPEASAFFDTLNKINRYAICYRVETARRPETRRARIATFIAMLAAHEKLHP